MKNIIQSYWGTKTKDEIKCHQLQFLVDLQFEYILFMATPIIV